MEFTLWKNFGDLSLNSTTAAKQKPLFSMPVPSQEYNNMPHQGQEYSNEPTVNIYEEMSEGEGDDENYIDDLWIPPSNFETTFDDPSLATFFHGLCENNPYCFPVASFQRTCYFNGTNSYAIPHNAKNHIQPASQDTAHIVEWWLTEKLLHTGHIGDVIPILDESPQISAETIMCKLRETASALNGLAKVFINIRAGHVYSLHMIDDVIVMNQHCDRFFKEFPLFVNVSIKVQEHLPSVRHNTCQVLVSVEHVTMKDNRSESCISVPGSCKFSQHHQFDNTFENTRVFSTSDGQTCCLLEEVATDRGVFC